MSRRRAVCVVTSALAMCASVSLHADAAGGASGPEVHVVGSSPHGYLEFTAVSGAVLLGAVVVTNPGPGDATFLFTPVDGYTSPTSGVVYGNRETPLRDGPSGNGEFGAGTWISLDQSQASLAAGQSSTVHATVSVPAGTHAGDWVGAVSAENPVSSGGVGGGTVALHVKAAAAIAVVVHVPGDARPGAVFLDRPTARVVGAHQVVDIPLRYTGDLLVKPRFSFQIKNAAGQVVYQHQGRWDTFMPHTTLVYELVLPLVLSPGDYTFTGTVGPDGNLQTFTYRLRIGSVPAVPGSGGGQPGSQSGSGMGWPGWLWAVIGVLALLLLLVLAALAAGRRCTHCRALRLWGLMRVNDYHEVSHCRGCRAVARARREVLLCPDCYRSHLIPAGADPVAIS